MSILNIIMGGGILQLVTTGIPDLYITGDPQITFFKIVYRRYTEFSMMDYRIKFNNDMQFGDTSIVKLGPIADKLHRITLVADIPTPELETIKPTVGTIKSLASRYGLNLELDPSRDNSDTITYRELFGINNDGPLSLEIIKQANKLNKVYNSRLDIFEFLNNNYHLEDNRYSGKYIAIKIDHIKFSKLGHNIDKEGYLLSTAITTKKIINALKNGNNVKLDETSFHYLKKTNQRNFELSQNMTSDIISTSFQTIDELVKIYPRMFSKYQTFDSVDELNSLNLDPNKFHHIIISISHFNSVRKFMLRALEQEIIDDEHVCIKNTEFANLRNRKLVVDDFDPTSLFVSGFEFGIYTFDIDENNLTRPDDYICELGNMLQKGKLSVSVDGIDGDMQIGRFHRYCINENAFFDEEFSANNNTCENDNDSIDSCGYWLLDVSDIDEDHICQNVIDLFRNDLINVLNNEFSNDPVANDINVNDKTIVKFNPIFLSTNSTRIGYSPYKIKRVWNDTIVRNTLVDNKEKKIKPSNMTSSISTLAYIVDDLYNIPNIKNATNIPENISFSKNDLHSTSNLHSLLLAMYNDLQDNCSESRNYRLDNIKLFNSTEIRQKMYEKLLTDIIYVDKRKIGYDYKETFFQFMRNTNDDVIPNTDKYIYTTNNNYNYTGSESEKILTNRNTVYEYTKFLIWSYYLEIIKFRNDKQECEKMLKFLSKMMIHVSKDATMLVGNVSPSDPTARAKNDVTTESIRFALNDLNLDRIMPYEDAIIENINASHRFGHKGQDNFETIYLFSGTRYDESYVKNHNSIYVDGIGTSINREVEFYHVIKSFAHDNITVNRTVPEYFQLLIDGAYRDKRNYIQTLSFMTTRQYLNDHFSDTNILNSQLSMRKIGERIIDLISRNVLMVFINYITYIFKVWKNSSYSDTEILPEFFVRSNDKNIAYVEYNSNYVMNHMIDNFVPNSMLPEDQFPSDPLIERIKYYSSIDQSFRPLMGYSYSYEFVNDEVTRYDEMSIIQETSRSMGKIEFNKFSQDDFRDRFIEYIDIQSENVVNCMRNIAIYNESVRQNMNYIYWLDFATYMTFIIDELNDDLGLSQSDIISNFSDTFVLNHIPVVITYYYGQALQHIINTQIMAKESSNDSPVVENILYNCEKNQEIFDDNIRNNIFPVSDTPEQKESPLKFMGTNVRLNPTCPFHGEINPIVDTNGLHKLFDKYLINNANVGTNLSVVCITDNNTYVTHNLFDQCPLCMRTYMYRELFKLTLYHTLLNPNINKNTIVDDQYIRSLKFKPQNTEEGNNTMFLFRPEDVIYDDVSKRYFYTYTEFVVHRIATIMFRYRTLIQSILNLSQTNYNDYIAKIMPSMPSSEQNEKYSEFIDYLQELRNANKIQLFVSEYNSIIAKITHTDDNEANFDIIENIYNSINIDNIDINTFKTYILAPSFIGGSATINNLGSYVLISNITHDNEGTNDTHKHVVYQMYRGNIALWTLIQRNMIDIYNEYFNNVLDPRKIDISVDVFVETYNYLMTLTEDRLITSDGKIDFYRNKQIREHEIPVMFDNVTVKDMNNQISINMIEYCRRLMIYYDNLLARYEKRRFLLNINNIVLNDNDYYFNFSQSIAEKYMEDIRKRIQETCIVNINPLMDKATNRTFYFSDTSEYYFVDKTNFRLTTEKLGISEVTNDFDFFDNNNNFHIRQAFTLNEIYELLHVLGLHDQSIIKESDIEIIYRTLKNNFDVQFNNDFNKYVNKKNGENCLDDTSKYLKVNVQYDAIKNEIFFGLELKDFINNGLFNSVWKKCPTISNILYDQYYRFIVLESRESSDFEEDAITNRLYSSIMVTTPLLYLNDKIAKSPNNRFNHTPKMRIFEERIHDSVEFGIPFRKLISHNNEKQNIYIDVYRAYSFFVGAFKFVDIYNVLDNIRYELISGDRSFSSMIERIMTVIDKIIKESEKALTIKCKNLRNQQILTILTVSRIKHINEFNIIQQSQQQSSSIIRDRLIQIENMLELSDVQNIDQIKTAINTIKENINLISKSISNIKLTNIINNVIAKINNINSVEDLRDAISINIDKLIEQNTVFINIVHEQILLICNLVNFTFVETEIDSRVFTPSILYNLRNITFLNNISSYRDALMLILSGIILYIFPSEMSVSNNTFNRNINPITLKGFNNLMNMCDIGIISSINKVTRNTAFKNILQFIKTSIESVLLPLSKIVNLCRHIDKTQCQFDNYKRYDFSKIMLDTDFNHNLIPDMSTTHNYQKHKEKLIRDRMIEDNTFKNKMKLQQSTQVVRAIRKNNDISLLKINENENECNGTHNKIDGMQIYAGSEFHREVLNLLLEIFPEHAWTRFLGIRMIEEVALIIDGEQIDSHDDELLLMLHKLFIPIEHRRGIDIMLGHIEEMYGINNKPRPNLRIHVNLFLFFCRHYGNSLPLVNMLYSDVRLKIKFRPFEELFYMANNARLKKPVKIKCHLLGNYIYLGDEERKTMALTKTESLIEKFNRSGAHTRTFHNIIDRVTSITGPSREALRLRFYFNDPCKYFIWKINVLYNDFHPTDKIFWDLGDFIVRNADGRFSERSKRIGVIDRTLISFNGKVREQWKDNIYFQILQSINKDVNPLDQGEYFYSFCLHPRLLQPSGATNLTEISDINFLFELSQDIVSQLRSNGIGIKITMWACTYNVFVTMSGFGALRFYGMDK